MTKFRVKIEILPLWEIGQHATAYRITAVTYEAVQHAIDRLTAPLNERSGQSHFYHPRPNPNGHYETCGFIEFEEPIHA